MQTTAKYLIHATVRTDGVVERSDVVGAIFGQTEGLLGDHLDLRDLQESSKVGRIDVSIDSEGGRSVGSITIASGLDRVETAVLGASLETIDRVGPCHADCTVTDIEDARAAKRRAVVERATELLDELEEKTVTTEQIVEEVRQTARVEEITSYEGYPAGPNVESSDAIIVVEGRADVRRLLKYGIKTAVAVEGTDIPPAIAELTANRNTTAFLDGDRGGDLILRELRQVGHVDYVAFAPTDRSVEDLDRSEILSGLRRKVPLEQVTDDETARTVFGPTEQGESSEDVSSVEPPETGASEDLSVSSDETPTESTPSAEQSSESPTDEPDQRVVDTVTEPDSISSPPDTAEDGAVAETVETDSTTETDPKTLAGHVEAVIGQDTGTVRFLDSAFDIIDEHDADDAFETLVDGEQVPTTVVIDGTLTQKLLDGAAQRGVGHIVAAELGNFVKQPTDVRIRTAAEMEVEV